MDTTGAHSHDSGSAYLGQVIPIRPGVEVAPRPVAAVRAARCLRAGGRAADWLRSPGTGRARRWTIALACAMMLGLMWWDSRSEGYSGLPINTLGQVLGDLIMMGIALPLVLTRRPREDFGECGFSAEELADQISRATRRVQLLDTGSTLFPEAYGSQAETGLGLDGQERADGAGRAGLGERGLRRIGGGRDARAARITLLRALRTALARDVAVEILLPRPDEMVPLDARTGLPARTIEQDLARLREAVPTGKLDIHHYRQAPAMAMVRCDDQLWVSFADDADDAGIADDEDAVPADSGRGGLGGRGGRDGRGGHDGRGGRRGRTGARADAPAGPGDRVYLRLDAHTRNARALVLHFTRLVAADRDGRGQGPAAPPDRSGPPPDQTPDPAAAAPAGPNTQAPRGQFVIPRQQTGRRTPPTGPAARPAGQGAGAGGEPAPRREPPPFLIVTAPIEDGGAELPQAGRGRRPGNRTSIRSDREGE